MFQAFWWKRKLTEVQNLDNDRLQNDKQYDNAHLAVLLLEKGFKKIECLWRSILSEAISEEDLFRKSVCAWVNTSYSYCFTVLDKVWI